MIEQYGRGYKFRDFMKTAKRYMKYKKRRETYKMANYQGLKEMTTVLVDQVDDENLKNHLLIISAHGNTNPELMQIPENVTIYRPKSGKIMRLPSMIEEIFALLYFENLEDVYSERFEHLISEEKIIREMIEKREVVKNKYGITEKNIDVMINKYIQMNIFRKPINDIIEYGMGSIKKYDSLDMIHDQKFFHCGKSDIWKSQIIFDGNVYEWNVLFDLVGKHIFGEIDYNRSDRSINISDIIDYFNSLIDENDKIYMINLTCTYGVISSSIYEDEATSIITQDTLIEAEKQYKMPIGLKTIIIEYIEQQKEIYFLTEYYSEILKLIVRTINEYNRYFSRDEMLVFISHVQLSLMENDKKTHRYKTIHDILIFILNKYNNPKMDYKLLIYKNLTIEYCNFMYDMYVKYNKKSSKMKLIE
jgi:hypothetical protein